MCNNKIAFLCDYKSYYGGNFIPSLMALEKKVSENGIQCVYILPNAARDRHWVNYLVNSGHIVEFINSNIKRTDFIKKLDSIVKQYNIGILHVHFGNVLNSEIYSYLNRSVKVIIHLHSDFTAGRKSLRERINNFIIYHILSRHTRFISVSPDFLKYNKAKTTWIPNALATERIPCTHKNGKDLRAELGVEDSDILCEIFGWSPQIKGVDIAVQAIKNLNDSGDKRIYLAIVCGREYTKEKMKEYIRSNTDLSSDEPYLLFLQPIEDVFSYHEAADIMISSSRSEGFPYSILEMLSIGKPCVVSNIPGTAWSQKYPVVFPFVSENVLDCTKAIENAIEKLPEKPLLDIEELIREEYSIDKWVEAVIKCYELERM